MSGGVGQLPGDPFTRSRGPQAGCLRLMPSAPPHPYVLPRASAVILFGELN